MRRSFELIKDDYDSKGRISFTEILEGNNKETKVYITINDYRENITSTLIIRQEEFNNLIKTFTHPIESIK